MTFQPLIHPRDILRPGTRAAIDAWLKSAPRGHDGETFLGIRQSFRIDLIPEARKLNIDQDVIRCHYPNLSLLPTMIDPFFLRQDKPDITFPWSGERTEAHMRAYRDPHFMLSHDETFLRLVNSDMPLLCALGGSQLHLYHLPGATIISTDADPARLAEDVRACAGWMQALCQVVVLPAESQHGQIRRAEYLQKVNSLLSACYSNAGDTNRRSGPGHPAPTALPLGI